MAEKPTWAASHIEDDEANPGMLLISSSLKIRTLNTTSKNDETLFGHGSSGYREYPGKEAEFNTLTGFRQVNKTTILAVDSENHCIRLLNRTSESTNPSTGQCTRSGRTDGVADAHFQYPHSIIDGQYKNEYFITDSTRSDNGTIRTYNLVTGLVTTLVSKLTKPKELVLDQNRETIFVTVDHGVAKINIASASFHVYMTYERQSIEGITRIPHSTDLLVTHKNDNKLTRLTDSGIIIATFCNGNSMSQDGNNNTCQIKRPFNVMFSYQLQAFVIGCNTFIRRLDISYTQGGNHTIYNT